MKIVEGGKVTRAKCINCGISISAKACRLRSHIEKCSSKQPQASNSHLFSPKVINDEPDIQPEKRVCCS